MLPPDLKILPYWIILSPPQQLIIIGNNINIDYTKNDFVKSNLNHQRRIIKVRIKKITVPPPVYSQGSRYWMYAFFSRRNRMRGKREEGCGRTIFKPKTK